MPRPKKGRIKSQNEDMCFRFTSQDSEVEVSGCTPLLCKLHKSVPFRIHRFVSMDKMRRTMSFLFSAQLYSGRTEPER